MHFDWLSPEAAGFKSQAAVSIKNKARSQPRDLKRTSHYRTAARGLDPQKPRNRTHQRKMRAVIVFMLLFAAVYCHPVKRSASSSESAEVQPVDTQALKANELADVSSEEDDVSDEGDNDDDSDSDESEENGQATSSPPVIETTLIPIINGRGDSIGYHSDYKKNGYYVDGNNIEKGPSSYKSYGSDKAAYDGADLKVYKALQVNNDGLDQGVDASSGTDSEDMSQQEQKSASDASPSQESEEDSQSSEEDTTPATTVNSNSSESDESEETNATDQPAQIKSKNPEVIIA